MVIRTVHHGLTGQWLNAWFPTDPSEVALILEDDNIVSPVFFIWLQEALATYFNNPDQHDPRLYGIALQNQHFIAGRYPKKPAELLKPEVLLYKYQLLSTWGPVFFASHWSNFVSWYADRSTNPKFFPMFSNLVTNKWFLERMGGRSVWSAWFIRYCAEKGLYMLYTNYPGGEALVVNHRESGKPHCVSGIGSNLTHVFFFFFVFLFLFPSSRGRHLKGSQFRDADEYRRQARFPPTR